MEPMMAVFSVQKKWKQERLSMNEWGGDSES